MIKIDENEKIILKLSPVEVFRTNVQEESQSKWLLSVLSKHFPSHKINFDLSDCDKILRVEGKYLKSELIIDLLNSNGYQCEVLV